MNFIPINVEKKLLLQMQEKLKELETRIVALEPEEKTSEDNTTEEET